MLILGRNIIETSIVVAVVKILLSKFVYLKKLILNICKDSQVYKKCSAFSKVIIISFTYSFLGRISEIKESHDGAAVIDNSKFIKKLLNICKTLRLRLINAETSAVVNSGEEIARRLYFSPIKTLSIITAIAILINISLSILFHNKDIGLLWWIPRIMFLFLALVGLFCNSRWPEIKETSLILKYANKYCKIIN